MYCENCGAKNGETDEQCWIRMGGDPTGAAFEKSTFIISLIAWGYACQYCKESMKKGHYYASHTGKPHIAIPIAWGVDEYGVPEDISTEIGF